MSIDPVLTATRDLVKTISVSNPPGDRVWAHPIDATSIHKGEYPFVIVSKLNATPGEWRHEAYGTGLHVWNIVIAVYLAPGPVIVTNTDEITVAALTDANEWYEAMAGLISANLTLSGTVQMAGDPASDRLYEYVTDNIIWDAQQHYGHLFMLPVYQNVIQTVAN